MLPRLYAYMDMKSQTTRLQEVLAIYVRLKELGVSEDLCPALGEFKKIANTFVKDGVSCEGKVKLPEITRVLVYRLTMQAHLESTVMLQMI